MIKNIKHKIKVMAHRVQQKLKAVAQNIEHKLKLKGITMHSGYMATIRAYGMAIILAGVAIALMRYSASVPAFVGLLFNIVSTAIIVGLIVYDLYLGDRTQPRGTAGKLAWKVPVAAMAWFLLLSVIGWLRGNEPANRIYHFMTVANLAAIMTLFYYMYQVFLSKYIRKYMQKNEP